MAFPAEKNYLPVILIIVVSLLTVYGIADLNEWDESRNGSNAFEMYHNHDWVNLYYNHQPDTWISKPPLLTWLIVLSYKIFGFNEFALRLPAYLSAILFFYVLYKLITLYHNSKTALYTCLITLSSKLIIGWHTGLTADYDMMLVFLLTSSIYFFIKYADFGERDGIYYTVLFTGLAFYCKGTAAFILIPGFIIYILLKHQLRDIIRSKDFYIASILLVLVVISWAAIQQIWGIRFQSSFYGGSNAISTLFFDDTIRRLGDKTFQDKTNTDIFFVFTALDVRLNVWSYLLYLLIGLIIYAEIKNKRPATDWIYTKQNGLILLSICLLLPFGLMMSFAQTQHDWYMIPVFVLIPYIIVRTLNYCNKVWKGTYLIAGFIFVFCFIRHTLYIIQSPNIIHNTMNRNNPLLKHEKNIVTIGMPRHHIYLYMQWMNIEPIKLNSPQDVTSYTGMKILLDKNQLKEVNNQDITMLQQFDEFIIARIN